MITGRLVDKYLDVDNAFSLLTMSIVGPQTYCQFVRTQWTYIIYGRYINCKNIMYLQNINHRPGDRCLYNLQKSQCEILILSHILVVYYGKKISIGLPSPIFHQASLS